VSRGSPDLQEIAGESSIAIDQEAIEPEDLDSSAISHGA
jgi:hypothetical protein